ncbi:MAG: hypothetical protein ACR2RF_33390, partial [Geminicoccaceae bacterium]
RRQHHHNRLAGKKRRKTWHERARLCATTGVTQTGARTKWMLWTSRAQASQPKIANVSAARWLLSAGLSKSMVRRKTLARNEMDGQILLSKSMI